MSGEDTFARSPRRPLPGIPLRLHPASRLQETLSGASVMLYVIHVYRYSPTNSCGCARHEGLFRLQFARRRVAQLDLAPTLAVFASRSVISTPPRFARDYSAHARPVISVETPRLRTSDAQHDEGVSRRPSPHAIRESGIASSPRIKWLTRSSRLSRSFLRRFGIVIIEVATASQTTFDLLATIWTQSTNSSPNKIVST